MPLFYVNTGVTQGSDSEVKYVFIAILRLHVIVARGGTVWYTKGKPRKVPIWCENNSLYFFKTAIRVGTQRKKSKGER